MKKVKYLLLIFGEFRWIVKSYVVQLFVNFFMINLSVMILGVCIISCWPIF